MGCGRPLCRHDGDSPSTSRSPDRTGVCCAGRSAPSQCEMATAPRFSSPNQPDQERTTASRDSSGSKLRSDAHFAIIVGDWEKSYGESQMNSIIGKFLATCLWLITGAVFAPDLRGQPSEYLNQMENYNSSTSQIIFNGSYTCSGVLINNTQDQGRPLILTAAHCIESEEDLNSIVVIFGKKP